MRTGGRESDQADAYHPQDGAGMGKLSEAARDDAEAIRYKLRDLKLQRESKIFIIGS